MTEITYEVVRVTSFRLRRIVESERRGAPETHSEDVGIFDTEAKAQEFADTLKLLDAEPGHDVGRRWSYGEEV